MIMKLNKYIIFFSAFILALLSTCLPKGIVLAGSFVTGIVSGGDSGAPKPTTLPPAPLVEHSDLGDLWLEIPSLDIKTTIVSVPQSMDGQSWDINGLNNQAGWLNSTSFPTWNSSNILTGQVWNANNTPGLFANLKQLTYGDIITVHAFGNVYSYSVRDNLLVLPNNLNSVLRHEEQTWLTLITSEDNQAQFGEYTSRRLVRAILTRTRENK
jgi:LPXTG-site transpeptidase (sortase) family protein